MEISARGNAQSPAHCAYFNIKAKKAGATARVSVIYQEPTSGRTLRAHTTVTSYRYKIMGTYASKEIIPFQVQQRSISSFEREKRDDG